MYQKMYLNANKLYSEDLMPFKVILGNPSVTTDRSPEDHSSAKHKTLGMERIFYQKLGSLVSNRKLDILYAENKIPLEYRRFLDDMNELYLIYANDPNASHIDDVREGIVKIDDWLGTLGDTDEYPYQKDWMNVVDWLEAPEYQSKYRVLVDLSDNTYLTFNNNKEILVSYNKDI